MRRIEGKSRPFKLHRRGSTRWQTVSWAIPLMLVSAKVCSQSETKQRIESHEDVGPPTVIEFRKRTREASITNAATHAVKTPSTVLAEEPRMSTDAGPSSPGTPVSQLATTSTTSSLSPTSFETAGAHRAPQSRTRMPREAYARALSHYGRFFNQAASGDDTRTFTTVPIARGVPVLEHFSVGLLITKETTFSSSIPLCTGTLIAPNLVLTAEHCFNDRQADNVVFFTHAGGLSNITGIFRYCDGRPDCKDLDHDIAIIELTQGLPMQENLELAESRPSIGTIVELVGFGETESRRRDSGIKRSGTAKVILCESIAQQAICTQNAPDADSESVPTAPCHNDSGGPLLVSNGGHNHGWSLAGVTRSRSACETDGVGYFTDVTLQSHRTWINELLSDRANGAIAHPSLVDLDHYSFSDEDPNEVSIRSIGSPQPDQRLQLNVSYEVYSLDKHTQENRVKIEFPDDLKASCRDNLAAVVSCTLPSSTEPAHSGYELIVKPENGVGTLQWMLTQLE